MRWARRVLPWTLLNHWRQVVFSDEFRVTLFKCDNRIIVWRQDNERYIPECLQFTRPQNRIGLMFWGCIGYGQCGHLVEVNGTMNRNDYIDVLQNHLLPSAIEIFNQPNPNFIFQHDNASPHTARDTVRWLEQQDWQTMMWPPYSPDMNIIETVWGSIMVKLRRDPPIDIQTLRNRVREYWGQITQQYLLNLYATLPQRVVALQRARGYPTKY